MIVNVLHADYIRQRLSVFKKKIAVDLLVFLHAFDPCLARNSSKSILLRREHCDTQWLALSTRIDFLYCDWSRT